MASAWGNSWGVLWGNSWGVISSQQDIYGAGDNGQTKKRKGKSYLDRMLELEFEALEARRLAALEAQAVIPALPVTPDVLPDKLAVTESPITQLTPSVSIDGLPNIDDLIGKQQDITAALAELKRRRLVVAYIALSKLH